jgi:uridine kinase
MLTAPRIAGVTGTGGGLKKRVRHRLPPGCRNSTGDYIFPRCRALLVELLTETVRYLQSGRHRWCIAKIARIARIEHAKITPTENAGDQNYPVSSEPRPCRFWHSWPFSHSRHSWKFSIVTSRPLVIGVAGGSGSGKTTVVRRIVESIGDGEVIVLEHDRYYRDRSELRLEERAALNYDHPDSLETDLLVQHVEALRDGSRVEVPRYDFARYCRQASTESLTPGRALIVEGILIYTDAALRRLMDVKVFVDTDDDTRFIRRLQRDISERGRTVQSVIDQYLSTVKPMHLEFVEPSKRYADIIVPQGGHNAVAIDMLMTLIRSLTAR